jgi:hypothetical protein
MVSNLEWVARHSVYSWHYLADNRKGCQFRREELMSADYSIIADADGGAGGDDKIVSHHVTFCNGNDCAWPRHPTQRTRYQSPVVTGRNRQPARQ